LYIIVSLTLHLDQRIAVEASRTIIRIMDQCEDLRVKKDFFFF